jgi:hypothetical protein
MVREKIKNIHTTEQSSARCVENLNHFNCLKCKKWWSVSEAPALKKDWFCPWCGIKNKYDIIL